MQLLAPAKLNVFLHITGKRANGYHAIESFVVFTEYGDSIEMAPASELTLEIQGPFAQSLQSSVEDNLIMRAARALQKHAHGEGAHITLTKNLPVGSGLGGGSSDAAATIKALTQLWNIVPNAVELQNLMLSLGADVPMCYAGLPALVSGIGEEVTPIDLRLSLWAVLCNPRIEISTAEIYRAMQARFVASISTPSAILSVQMMQEYLAGTANMLEPAAFALCPELQDILAVISKTENCLHARMSGSGATCYGLYASQEAAQLAQEALQKNYPGYWVIMSPVQQAA